MCRFLCAFCRLVSFYGVIHMHTFIGLISDAPRIESVRSNRSFIFILACTFNIGFAWTDLIYSFSMPAEAAENSFYSSYSSGQMNYPAPGGYSTQPYAFGSTQMPDYAAMNQTTQTQQAPQQNSLWNDLQEYQYNSAPVQMPRPPVASSDIWQANQNQTPNNRWRATFGVPAPATIKYDSGSKFSEL